MIKHKQYVLIEVVAQNISAPAVFKTQDDATKEMHERLKKVMNLTNRDMALAEELDDIGDMKGIDEVAIFGKTMARCVRNSNPYDWRIFAL